MGDIYEFDAAKDSTKDKWKGGKLPQKSFPGSVGDQARKGLMDITNLHHKPNSRNSTGGEKPQRISDSADTRDYVDHLQKEIQALMQALAERNKLIELSGIELQKLRINLQKTQQKNWELARTNTHMLMELNSGKDRLKSLQHELGCMRGILRVKNLESQEKQTLGKCQPAPKHAVAPVEIQTAKPEKAAESSQVDNTDSKRGANKGKRRSKASSASDVKSTVVKEKAEAKRLCARRQSARLKSEEPKSNEDLFEIDEARFPVQMSPIVNNEPEESAVPSISLIEDNDVRRESTAGSGSAESRRASVGRPLRRAAERVQTYKEKPLNVKMRRPAT